MLIFGESIIVGIGAALLMPASLAIISMLFTNHHRAKAFAVWGGAAGASAALGPVLGG
jgi:MFS family permease